MRRPRWHRIGRDRFIAFPLPRWLPGFVKPYQVSGPRSAWAMQVCPWWRESNLSVLVPLFPPGIPTAYRTRRMGRRWR